MGYPDGADFRSYDRNTDEQTVRERYAEEALDEALRRSAIIFAALAATVSEICLRYLNEHPGEIETLPSDVQVFIRSVSSGEIPQDEIALPIVASADPPGWEATREAIVHAYQSAHKSIVDFAGGHSGTIKLGLMDAAHDLWAANDRQVNTFFAASTARLAAELRESLGPDRATPAMSDRLDMPYLKP